MWTLGYNDRILTVLEHREDSDHYRRKGSTMASPIMPPVLIRARVARYINGQRQWLHEYLCPTCGGSRLATTANAGSNRCANCKHRGVAAEPRTVQPVLVRSKVAQYIKNRRAWLHEYLCPACGGLRLATTGCARHSPKCGKCKGYRHGGKGDPRYDVWRCMRQRCRDANTKFYANYGGRGIAVCDAWQTFPGFMSWDKFDDWKPGLELDRIDNDGNYEPENCRWATREEQVQNRSNTRFTPDDIRMVRMLSWSGLNQSQIAKIFGVSVAAVSGIVNYKSWRNI
jgi:hypothetical protein